MNKRIVLSGFFFIMFIFKTSVVMAEITLGQPEAEKLLKGNTVEGVNTKWNKHMIWYFQEDGTLIKQTPDGGIYHHNWSIDQNGRLCYKDGRMEQPKCRPIIQRTDGKYEAHGRRWRFDRILPGNPHNFQDRSE